MKACVIKIADFLKLDASRVQRDSFSEGKRSIVVPLYQREYKWSKEKVEALINDIKRNAKFLGNIIIDEKDSCYEIVDGQQRTTTIVLAIVAMYNYYKGHNLEQESLNSYIQPYGDWILKNQSVGDYLLMQDGNIEVNINSEDDVYRQKTKFDEVSNILKMWLDNLPEQDEVRDFKDKLLDCEVLVLINTNTLRSRPVEQLFLDINEKSQQLDVEDVFKGHCFENYYEEYHETLKNQWVEFKKVAMDFDKFGFKTVNDYLYLYLLMFSNPDMPNTLTNKGKHYLEGKTMDETSDLLKEMTTYGKCNIRFLENLKSIEYYFTDLCKDSFNYKNTTDISIMKQMCIDMLDGAGTATYQKMPLLSLVYILSSNQSIVDSIAHNDFKKILTNLYVYMALFIYSNERKSKKAIDHTVKNALLSDDPIKETVIAAKELRKLKVESFCMKPICDKHILYFIYSVTDNYKASDNWINKIYSKQNGDTDEHFIIADCDKIEWVEDDKTKELKDFSKDFIRENKKKSTNYLIIPGDLNRSLGHKDIITKIEKIKCWYSDRSLPLPKHIENIISYVENMDEYKELLELKDKYTANEKIKEKYFAFWKAYFNDESKKRLIEKITGSFKSSFQNNN